MDKLKMAHELLVSALKGGAHLGSDHAGTAQYFFDLADAMQAEADKRAVKPDVGNADVSDFQIDWSQAPKRATAWKIDDHGVPMWLQGHNNIYQPYVWLFDAPTFGYTGAWQDSLRKRPTE